jgi:hypothetical protein
MTTFTSAPGPGHAASRRIRPVPLVIGILLALVGVPLLLGGLGLGWAMANPARRRRVLQHPDRAAHYPDSGPLQRGREPRRGRPDDWWADRDLATVRLSARSADASPVSIGIAPSADVARYLGSASYDEISDLLSRPFAQARSDRDGGCAQ